MQVHQKEGESLRDYMQRFNKATLDIDNIPDTICLSALLHGQGQRTTTQNQKDRKGVGYVGIPPTSGKINMISGGIHSGGQNARGRKAYARQVMTINKNRPLKRPFKEAEWENVPITFSPANYKRAEGELDVTMPHANPFVATVHISNHNVNKVFIDISSSPNILYWSCFQKMQLNPSLLQKYEGPIYGFHNQPIPIEGVITLPIYVGSEPRFRIASVNFLVVKMESAFNAILGRATLGELKVVISQPHLCMKFPTPQRIGRNVEVYVDDMIVTNVRAEDHIDDLSETFHNLRRAQMKLNPLKCTFVVESGKFLGYVVSKKGIEVNPEKVQAVQQMEQPKTIKDVQRLTGHVAALHRFIARSAERCLPFFKALREPKNFQWTDEC
ncbi:hypothetical protein SLEP1_g49396 [Rubroshorea leprosula]|uniref:Reverse transcriptase domain-containing protein n=1 Tax=Rubroshorea leprosula TaxID=152421 RepID=A0AAV5LYX7_9ROSI|nr:hypothetical protein SLEP1_g49396 [Rubroshorea leprosula]